VPTGDIMKPQAMAHDNPYKQFGVVPRNLAATESGLAFLLKLLDGTYPAPPISEACDLWLVEVEEGRAVFEGQPSPRFYNPMGIVHGGWISTVLDSAMGCAVHSMLKAGQAYTTVEMKVNFVRPVLEHTGIVRCEGKIVHSGGRLATSEGRLTDAAGKLLAHGSETCLILSATN
jgi:uncharacterized protein (TIGR00369 family)